MSQQPFFDPAFPPVQVTPSGQITLVPAALSGGPEPGLAAQVPPDFALRHGVLPWRRVGGATLVLTSGRPLPPRAMARLRGWLGELRLLPVSPALLREHQISAYGTRLRRAAERSVRPDESCASMRGPHALHLAALLLLAALILWSPVGVLIAVLGWSMLTLLAAAGLRLLALATQVRPGPARTATFSTPDLLPRISLLVPLFEERDMTGHLLDRLLAINYPRDRLDLCLILEADDATTREAIETVDLPDWAQVITVPEGRIRTKPRALNYALPFAKGEIIGVYDAEDAPAPDQLLRVAARFAEAPANVACLQGVLDYYNPTDNWLARCFTLEYAGWFRVLLPALVRLGLIVPLGGTTLFLRRAALRETGAWDAHNVTEDADLGVRLARYGFRTEMLDSTTGEEANCRPWPWVRQRTRWLKGYAKTWAVFMRRPLGLMREVGLWRFLGLQVLFLGTLTQFLLAPLLWLVGGLLLIAAPQWAAGLPGWALPALTGLLLASLLINLTVAALGARRAGKPWLALWAPLMIPYFLLATLAAWRGLGELISRPHYWDKTTHGHSLARRGGDQPASTRRASSLSRV